MSNKKLQDKVVIITGGTSGIGRSTVLRFCREGAKVVIGARNEGAGAEITEEICRDGRGEVFFVKTDVSDPVQVENLVNQTMKRYGRVDVLFGNSGVNIPGTAPDYSIDDFRKTIDTNVGGYFYLSKYGIPALIESGGKVIMFNGSELGNVGASGMVAYCASKGAIANMTRALAIDCAPHGIRVNCLAPGPISTPLKEEWLQKADDPEALLAAQTKPILLKRYGTPEEVAELALFLATDASSYITGAIIVADGGATAWYGM